MTNKEILHMRYISLMGESPNKSIKNIKFIHESPILREYIISQIDSAILQKERVSQKAREALSKYIISKKVLTEVYKLKNTYIKDSLKNEAIEKYKASKSEWISLSNEVRYWKRVRIIRFYCLNELDDLLKTLRKAQREKEDAQSN